MPEYSREKIKDPVDQQILEALKDFADAVISKHTIATVAEETGLSRNVVTHMRLMAKGSATTWVRLLLFVLNKSPEDLPQLLRKMEGVATKTVGGSDLNGLIDRVRKVYSEDELHVWLQLLLSKHKLEQGLSSSKTRQSKGRSQS